MKRLISLIIIAILSLSLVACGQEESPAEAKEIRIGYMAGPTGMGMAKLIHDNGGVEGNATYKFTKYTDTNTAKADLAANKIDLICLPTNEAAAYYNQFNGSINVLAVNCLNSLYLLSDSANTITSLSVLEGKTVYTCKNGTPRLILEYILKENGINATVSYEINGKTILTPADVGTLVVSGELPIAVMPEPIITSSLLTIAKNGDSSISYSVDLDLADGWSTALGEDATPITMGCVVASSDFVKKNGKLISAFLAEYNESIEFIGNSENLQIAADYVVETGVMAAKPAAIKALTNLGDAIAYIDGADMKEALVKFYEVIGLKLPDEKFYYIP